MGLDSDSGRWHRAKGDEAMQSEYHCVQVNHHKDVADTIASYQSEGWRLHTYQAAGTSGEVKHYLLFERR
jgi:hypothetical protein